MSDDRLKLDDPKVLDTNRVFASLDQWLPRLEMLQECLEDAHLMGCLVKSSLRAYLHLRAGWQTDSTYVAWGCRNLLELRIFAAYVTKSPSNRQRFTDDATVDSSQSLEAISDMIERENPGASSSDPDILLLRQNLRALRSVSEYQGNRYLLPTVLATDVNLKGELNLHKLCSKLVHPSAQSVLLINRESQDERDALFLCGCRYLIEISNELAPFIETLLQQHQTPVQGATAS